MYTHTYNIDNMIIMYVLFMYLFWHGGGTKINKCCISVAGDVNSNAYSSDS